MSLSVRISDVSSASVSSPAVTLRHEQTISSEPIAPTPAWEQRMDAIATTTLGPMEGDRA